MRPAPSFLLVPAVVLTACVVSPLPEPPPLSPIAPADVSAGQCGECDGSLDLRGAPGSVPPGALVWIANLDDPFEPTTTLAAGDGSFFVRVFGRETQTLRLQVRLDDRRSTPIDAIAMDGSALVALPHPLGDCLVIDPEHELDLGTVPVGESERGAIVVRNRCADPIELGVRLRAPAPSFVIGAIDAVLPAGGSAPLEVELTAGAAGVHEEVILIETTAPAVDRRAVNIRGLAQ
jgi:hypothetical protein